MIQYELVLAIIFIHWFADFYCQSHNMAINKSTSNHWLFDHITAYTVVWALIGIMFYSPEKVVIFCFITFHCHFITDYFTSRWTSKLWKQNRIHDFFVVIGIDQVLHYIQLFLTFKLISSL